MNQYRVGDSYSGSVYYMNMHEKSRYILSYLSSGTLIIGAAIAIYALANIYLIESKLPSGVCPVTSNRPLLYISITLCSISFILSFFEKKSEKIKGQ